MTKTNLPIPDYSPHTIVYDVADVPEGDPTISDGRLNVEHLQRVLTARDEMEARKLVRVSR